MAPASSASRMRSRSENEVSTTMRASGFCARTRPIASMPSMLGIERSMRVTSGRSARAIVTASAPSDAAPTTSMSSTVASSWVSPERTTAWSSASRTRIMAPPERAGPRPTCARRGAVLRGRSLGRHLEAEDRAALGSRLEREGAAAVAREVLDHLQPEVAVLGDAVFDRPAAVVGDGERDAAVVARDLDLDEPGVGVLDDVAQRLLRGAEHRALAVDRQAQRGVGLQLRLQAAGGEPGQQVGERRR